MEVPKTPSDGRKSQTWKQRKFKFPSNFLTIFWIVTFSLQISMSRSNKHSDLRLLDSLLEKYDRRATPTNHIDDATNVTCELYIRSFGSIDPSSMDYQVDLYLSQSWEDQRLNHTEIQQPLDLNDPNLVKAIWKPEVYFPNAKKAEFQFVTVPNVLIRIDTDGRILYMLRLKLTFACMMEMSKFPLDSQVCTMEIASFSKTTKELTLSWKSNSPIMMYKQLKMPQFQIEKIIHTTCSESIQIGNYSCLVAEFHLKRSIGFHLVQSYLPTILIVAISWVSFWMDVDSVPARTTLGVTTLLAVSTKSGIQDGLPQVSYVKAIDVWMGACTAFVFTSLLEFTLVNYLFRKRTIISIANLEPCSICSTKRSSAEFNGQSKGSVVVAGPGGLGVVVTTQLSCPHQQVVKQTTIEDDRNSSPFECRCSCIPHSPTERPQKPSKDPFYLWWHRWKMRNSKQRAQDIDEYCRYLFPFAFSLFNAFYWSYYLCF